MQQSGLSLLLFCVPLFYLLSFLFHCYLCVWNQHCLRWKIFCTYSVSQDKRGRSPEMAAHFICVYTLRISVYTWDSLSRTTSGVCTSFFPSPHLRASRTPRVVGLLEEFFPQKRHVARRDSTRQLSPENKWIKWRAFFRSFHRNEFVYQVVILHRIQSFPEFCFRHFGSCYFGTTVSRMHVREHCLLHGIAVFRLRSQFLSMRQAMYDLNVMSSEFPSISPPSWWSPVWRVSFNPNNHPFTSCAISRSAKVTLMTSKEISGMGYDSFSATYNWTSRFKMMTINEVSLNRPKLFPIAMRFSAEILSP